MGNSTTFLTLPAGQRLGTEIVHMEREIDFSVENLAASGTMDVLRLPKGAVPLQAGWITKTVNTDTSAKLAVGVAAASMAIVAAAVLRAANSVVITHLNATKVLTADDTLRITGSVATLAQAKVVVFVDYIVSDACRN